MKIVLSIHHIVTNNAGAPGVVYNLANEYRRLGHNVEILSFDCLPNSFSDLQCRVAFPWYVAAEAYRSHRDADVIDASFGDAWLLYSAGVLPRNVLKVCHSHGLEHLADQRFREQVAQGGVGWTWKYPIYHGGFRLWEVKRSIAAADLTLFINKFERSFAIAKFGLDPQCAALGQNGVPDWLISSAQHISNSGAARIVQIASFCDRKGRGTAALALGPLMIRRPNVTFLMLGTGVGKEEIRQWYPPDVRDRVEVVPNYAQEDLPKFLHDCAITIFPSESEGFGIGPVEAMAFGAVPIVSDIPGPTEYISHRVNGLLVPRGDANALGSAIETLLDDHDLRKRLSAKAVETARGLGWSKVARDRLALYEMRRMALSKR